jgi:hypothetical protein
LHFLALYEKLRKHMNKSPLGEYSLSGMVGAIVGSIGGLFAIGLVRAILTHNIILIFRFPILGLISWIVCGGAGWFLGGLIGPWCGEKFRSYQAELLGGALGGLIPVILLAIWAWYMTPH